MMMTNGSGCVDNSKAQPDGSSGRVDETTEVLSTSVGHHDEQRTSSTHGTIEPSSPPLATVAVAESSSGVSGAVAVVGGHLDPHRSEKGESYVADRQEIMENQNGTLPPPTKPGAVAVAGCTDVTSRGQADGVDRDTIENNKSQNRTSKRRDFLMQRHPPNEEDQQSRNVTNGLSVEGKDDTVEGTLKEGEGGSLAVEGTKSATIADMPRMEYEDDSKNFCTNESDELIDASCSITVENVISPENEGLPTIQAELVPPPVEAFRVSIDEDPLQVTGLSPLELEHASRNDNEDYKGWCTMPSYYRWFIISVLVVAAICAITIPLVVVGSNQANSEVEQTPTVSPSYPYDCYTSTLAILRVQLYEESIPEAFVICPNTVIEIGTFRNPSTNDFHIVNGDYPLTAVRPDVVIQCGVDGRQDNNCVFDGGFIQVLTQQQMPPTSADGFVYVNSTIDNFTLRGLTFTGMSESSGIFKGNSVSMSNPGKNIRFEDCLWSNFSAPIGLILVGQNAYQDLVGQSVETNLADVTLFNCVFENIVYDRPLIMADGQNLTVEQSLFRNIQLSAMMELYCRSPESDSNFTEVDYDDGCAMLLYCGGKSVCTLKDLCVYNFTFQGVSLVQKTHRAQLEYDNLFLDVAGSDDDVCQLTAMSIVDDALILSNCTDIFLSPTCSLAD